MQKIHLGLRSRLDNTVVFGGGRICRRPHADSSKLDRSPGAGRHLQRLVQGTRHRDQHGQIGASVIRPSNQAAHPGSPIQLGTGARRAPVLKLQPLKEPLRILGMYAVSDGSHAPIYQMCEELAESQAELLRSRAMTDKIALFVTRAVLMPALTYTRCRGSCSPTSSCTGSSCPSCTPSSTLVVLPPHSRARSYTTGWLARCRDSRQRTRRTT
jgi:hypothetical protein